MSSKRKADNVTRNLPLRQRKAVIKVQRSAPAVEAKSVIPLYPREVEVPSAEKTMRSKRYLSLFSLPLEDALVFNPLDPWKPTSHAPLFPLHLSQARTRTAR